MSSYYSQTTNTTANTQGPKPGDTVEYSFLKCEKAGHMSRNLNLVCASANCASRGLMCQVCVNEGHFQHQILPLESFLKEKNAIQSTKLASMSNYSRMLNEIKLELIHYFQSLEKTMVQVIRDGSQRAISELERDQKLIREEEIREQQATATLLSKTVPASLAKQSIIQLLNSQNVSQEEAHFEELVRKHSTSKSTILNDTHQIAAGFYSFFNKLQMPSSIPAAFNTNSTYLVDPTGASPRASLPNSSSIIRSASGSRVFSRQGSAMDQRYQSQQASPANPIQNRFKQQGYPHENDIRQLLIARGGGGGVNQQQSSIKNFVANNNNNNGDSSTRRGVSQGPVNGNVNRNGSNIFPNIRVEDRDDKLSNTNPPSPNSSPTAGQAQNFNNGLQQNSSGLMVNVSSMLQSNFGTGDQAGLNGYPNSNSRKQSFIMNQSQVNSLNGSMISADISTVRNNKPSNSSFYNAFGTIQHGANIRTLELMDSDRLVTGGYDKLLKVWDRHDGKLISTLSGHVGTITAIKYFNRVLASGSENDVIIVWKQVPLLQKVHALKGQAGTITALTFQGERSIISSSSNRTIWVWDIDKGEAKRKINLSDEVPAIGLVVHQKTLVSINENYVSFWELGSFELLKKVEAHSEKILAISLFTRKKTGNTYIMTCSQEGHLYIWDSQKQFQESDRIEEDTNQWNIQCLDYNVENDCIVYASNPRWGQASSKVCVYSLETKRLAQQEQKYASKVVQLRTVANQVFIALDSHILEIFAINKNK